MKVSIIVPIYKAESVIKKCLLSLINQTFKNIEIIAIEDRGGDKSYVIIQKIAQKDNRIRCFQNDKNLGVDKTRFKGMKLATGDYFMFVDADDWLSKQAVELLYNKIQQEKADIVMGAFIRVMDKWGVIRKINSNNYSKQNMVRSIVQPELFEDYFISYFGINNLHVTVWGKIYRRSLLDQINIKPSGFKMGEDLIFNMQLHPYLNKIAFIEEPVYYYRYGGMTTQLNPSFLEDIKAQYLLKKEMIVKHNYLKAERSIKYELVNVLYSHLFNLFRIEKLTKGEVLDFLNKELEDPIYRELKTIEKGKGLDVFEKNSEKIIEQVFSLYKKERPFLIIKRILSSILN